MYIIISAIVVHLFVGFSLKANSLHVSKQAGGQGWKDRQQRVAKTQRYWSPTAITIIKLRWSGMVYFQTLPPMTTQPRHWSSRTLIHARRISESETAEPCTTMVQSDMIYLRHDGKPSAGNRPPKLSRLTSTEKCHRRHHWHITCNAHVSQVRSQNDFGN